MITVRCLGHIKTSVGAEEVQLDVNEIDAAGIIDKLRAIARDGGDPGFDKFNTLALFEDGEAFVAASSNRRIGHGASVVLIPFSHGG
jgi:hypothetical protein